MKQVFGILLAFLTIGCSSEPEKPFELPEKPTGLIAGDSTKTWKLARRFNNGTRMNMGDCFLAFRQTFNVKKGFDSSAPGRTDCGDPMIGKWSLAKDPNGVAYLRLESEQIPEMMNIDENFKLFKIKALSDSLMVLQFNHAQTTKKQTTLVDYFVPEGVDVDDRDFHW